MRNIILLSIMIAVSAAFFASAHPDGLEKVAETLGFIESGVERSSIMTDYSVSFITHQGISTSVAGILGIFLTLGLFWGIAFTLKKTLRYNK
ncbi:MAG: PDGLE domain-containing protein [Candidatus Saganbacteria bacterium]|nr:PDGLE domain-containing protein [Candidatus Saganbacteria bacterium]